MDGSLTNEKSDVITIKPGLVNQSYIQVDRFVENEGELYEKMVYSFEWEQTKSEGEDDPADDETDGRDSHEATHHSFKQQRAVARKPEVVFASYLTDSVKSIRLKVDEKARSFYEQSVKAYADCNFERTLRLINRAIFLNVDCVDFYLLQCDTLISLGRYKGALATIAKLNHLVNLVSKRRAAIVTGAATPTAVVKLMRMSSSSELDAAEIAQMLDERKVLCYFMLALSYYDCRMFAEALHLFEIVCDCQPSGVLFKIHTVSCLCAMGRGQDGIVLLNKVITEHFDSQDNAAMLILRAKIHFRSKNLSECYLDLKRALEVDNKHDEGVMFMRKLVMIGENLRNNGLILSFKNRVPEAIAELNGAITINPSNADYYMQRGILYKRLKNFNAAIEDFLTALEKQQSATPNNTSLHDKIQRQILLTYNDFALFCIEKKYYEDAVFLLNKAIKMKEEKGFYVNRGYCFYQMSDKRFALLDYEQANEIDPADKTVRLSIANIYYDFAVEKYQSKEYESALDNFNKAISYSPRIAKFYISRARILFLLEKTYDAQIDICKSILLDPANPEIPNIIIRLFPSKNLDDVMNSVQMMEAKSLLNSMNVPNLLE